LGLGVIYDIYRRRKQLFAAYALGGLVLIVYPLAIERYAYAKDGQYWFYITNLCLIPLSATSYLPFIPDLIREES